MAISGWLKGLAVVTVGAALLCNLPTRLWLTAEKATVQYLADTSLQTFDDPQRQFKVCWSNTWVTYQASAYNSMRYWYSYSICLSVPYVLILEQCLVVSQKHYKIAVYPTFCLWSSVGV